MPKKKPRHPSFETPDTRAKRQYLREQNRLYSATLQSIPADQWPQGMGESANTRVEAVWRSCHFLVQIVWEKETSCRRLTVNRTTLNAEGNSWEEYITWDELMEIKRQTGHAETWAVEVYPADTQTVNVANMRHLFLLDEAPAQAWKRTGSAGHATPKPKPTLWYGGKSDRQINEELRSYFDERRHQANQMLETHIREAITLRLGMMPALEELAGRMHRYIASDIRHELIVLDHLPLLHVEWWPQPDSAETSHAMHMLKITPMHPDSPLPFPIQDL